MAKSCTLANPEQDQNGSDDGSELELFFTELMEWKRCDDDDVDQRVSPQERLLRSLFFGLGEESDGGNEGIKVTITYK